MDARHSLHAVAKNRHLAVIRLLVKEAGVNVNQADNDGSTPLFIAAQNGYLDVVRLLVEELGADVNQARYDGTTPLYIAAQYGHLDVVRCLVKGLGANVNNATYEGYTPSMGPVEHKFENVVKMWRQTSPKDAVHRQSRLRTWRRGRTVHIQATAEKGSKSAQAA
jgi:ankyrin repeat protein